MLPVNLINIKEAIALLDEESRIVLLDFDNKKAEVNNLLSGFNKYEKENPEMAKQMKILAQKRIDELESLDSKLDQICKKQDELRKKLMIVFKKEEKKEENKEGTARELSVRKVIKAEKKRVVSAGFKPAPTKVKPVIIKKEEVKVKIKEKRLGSKSAKSYVDQANQATKAVQELSKLATGKSYGNA